MLILSFKCDDFVSMHLHAYPLGCYFLSPPSWHFAALFPPLARVIGHGVLPERHECSEGSWCPQQSWKAAQVVEPGLCFFSSAEEMWLERQTAPNPSLSGE